MDSFINLIKHQQSFSITEDQILNLLFGLLKILELQKEEVSDLYSKIVDWISWEWITFKWFEQLIVFDLEGATIS